MVMAYGIKLVFVQKITFMLRKIIKTAATKLHFLTPISIKSFVVCGFAPDYTGAYSTPPNLLHDLEAYICRKKRRRERRGCGTRKRNGRKVQQRRGGKERVRPLSWEEKRKVGAFANGVRAIEV